jgi:hypothetical protein
MDNRVLSWNKSRLTIGGIGRWRLLDFTLQQDVSVPTRPS